MKLNLYQKIAGKLNQPAQQEEKEDLMHFVKKQFKELAKKNLSIPITLYQL